MELIKSDRIVVTRDEKGKFKLTVEFIARNETDASKSIRYSWMPHWDTVRKLINGAVCVETLNDPESKQLEQFDNCLEYSHHVLTYLGNLLAGVEGKEE